MQNYRFLSLLWTLSLISLLNAQIPNEGLKLHYNFQSMTGSTITDVTGNGFNGTLFNGATISNDGILPVLKLGTSNGYLDMGANTGSLIATLGDFTVSTYLYINPTSNITGNGNFAWAFSTLSSSNQTNGKYVAYRVNTQRYAQTLSGWGSESAINIGAAAQKGIWRHVVYTQAGNAGTIYLDGQIARTGTVNHQPKDIGTATSFNWLGRPPFSNDAYLRGASYADFRIYDRALTANEVQSFLPLLYNLNYDADSIAVEAAATSLILNDLDAIRTHITLPTTSGSNVAIQWASSNTAVIAHNGSVTRPAAGHPNAEVVLTATLTKGSYFTSKQFTANVLANMDDAGATEYDASRITINTERCYFLGSMQLPSYGREGSLIRWQSSHPEYLTNSGDLIKLPEHGAGTMMVELTATVSKGNSSIKRSFSICIQEDEGFAGYIFAYFTGNSVADEHIFFALSSDGYTYKTLNGGKPVITADTISLKNGVRDPHILRGPDGKFYMVVTDLRTSEPNCNWACNWGIVLLKSDDLVTWTHSTVDLTARFPGEYDNVRRAWAPQTFYDEQEGKMMVYFSMRTTEPGSYDIIYYAYTNDDFTDLVSKPQVLFDNGASTIDGDIIYRDSTFHLFFKTEDAADKGYKKAVSDQLTKGYVLQDRYLDQTDDAVEGACVFRMINQEKYILMYDVYTRGRYEFTESNDLENFRLVTQGVSMDFHPRHGTVMPITKAEAERLVQKWGSDAMVNFGTARSTQAKPINIAVDEPNRTVHIPVKHGTDLSTFDPLISATVPGISVSPQGPQNFSQGAVNYQLSLKGSSKNYQVAASVHNNPIITGYFADPEILYSEKTGKFYIYPTSDGFRNWGGHYFKVFSSDDLVHWTDEGVIIDLHDATQVSWANTNAWAPGIIEKKINGEYKYVFYFSGGVNGGTKRLGYAVADHPTGPFVVSGAPLIDVSPTGSGQQIDASLFTDPVTNTTYLYWGNGYLAVAELNDDLTSLKTTPQVITPSSNYTEGVYVFHRDGKYYFMWSFGNTGNADYRVYYGMSNSPTGPVNIPANNNILLKDVAKGINGPGHNSVVQIPGTDEWYIVYHRISRPNGITNTDPGPGNVRELCIDELRFNADGTIQQVIPTLEGIQPVSLPELSTDLRDVVEGAPKGALLSIAIFNISGVRVSNDQDLMQGIYIVQRIYEGGRVEFSKEMLGDHQRSNWRY